jgi:hypothetical protein
MNKTIDGMQPKQHQVRVSTGSRRTSLKHVPVFSILRLHYFYSLFNTAFRRYLPGAKTTCFEALVYAEVKAHKIYRSGTPNRI